METAYKYDSKTIWAISIQYLFVKQANALLIACALPILFVIQSFSHDINFFGYLSLLTPLIWLSLLLINTQKRATITKENKNTEIRIFIDNEVIISQTPESKLERTWNSFKELIFLQDYLLLVEKATAHHIVVPRKEKRIEEYITTNISNSGGYVPSTQDIKISKRTTRRLATVIVVFLAATLILMKLGTSPEWNQAKQATTEIEKIVRYRFGKKVKIYPSFDKTIGEPTIKNVITIINSDSIDIIADTLKMEWSILRVIDSLITFTPESYVFGYETRKSKIATETFYRNYTPKQVKEIVEEAKRQEK